jgi:predicted nucleic acid-binding protein
MRVLIDTNILTSASLSSEGTPYQAYIKAVTHPNHGMVCEIIWNNKSGFFKSLSSRL